MHQYSWHNNIQNVILGLNGSLAVLYLEVVFLEPLVAVPGVIVVDHPPDVDWVVPEIAESSGRVVALTVVLVGLVSHPGGQEGETFPDVL